MTEPSGRWPDLAARLASALVMLVIGAWGVWSGGDVFHVLVAVICGLMVWELTRMLVPDAKGQAIQLGAIAGAALLLAIYLPPVAALPLLIAPALVGFGQMLRHGALFAVFTAGILMAGFGIMSVRDDLGFGWVVWLIAVVVATDVLGYFVGRLIGGPKFWPRVSPKKTWSGTIGGWVGSAVVGAVFAINTGIPALLIGMSVLVSIAAQMGDIAESAVKRKVGVKDSSGMIPGHGGLLDRFDGMLGASLFVLIVEKLLAFPPGLL